MTKNELTEWLAARTREAYKPRYRFMSRRKRLIYKNILLGLVMLESKIKLDLVSDARELDEIVQSLMYDNPIIFYAEAKGYVFYNDRTEILFDYRSDVDEIIRTALIMDAALSHLRKKCEGKSTLEKMICVHNSLVEQVTYDLTDDLPIHKSHCVFLHRKAVCDGISKAAAVMFGALSIDSFILSGDAHSSSYIPGENTRHAWNMVRYDGDFYHMDITFDNTLSQGNMVYSYDYFNLTDEQIDADHESDFRRIPSGSARVDFYTLTSRIFSSEEELGEFFLQRLKAGEKCFRFRLSGLLSYLTTGRLLDISAKLLQGLGYYGKVSAGRSKYIDSYFIEIDRETNYPQ